jgi:hypothetical protein
MGLFGGAVVGVIVGSFLGHRAIAHLWLYWLLVLVAAAVMAFLHPLI